MSIEVLLVDVGGVLLTNGWDSQLREKAAKDFALDFKAMQSRHDTMFEFLERGDVTLNDYLHYVVFYQKRSFSLDDFRAYMFDQVQAYEPMMNLIADLKNKYKLKIGVFSNEAKELACDRFSRFPFFKEYVDAYIVSGYVRLRKPDVRMYHLALGVHLAKPAATIFIDDRAKNLLPAAHLGLHTIQHVDAEATAKRLARLLN